MNLKQLRAFAEVVNTGSVSEAARQLHRSQPAISAVIASLEDELGMPLFLRQGMRLKPAPEAYFLLKEATGILDRVDSVQRTMEGVRNLEQGVLELFCMPGPTVCFVPHLIAAFCEGRDELRVSLVTRSSPEVEQAVASQKADMGFADYELIEDESSELVEHTVFDLECYCAMHRDDPLAALDTVTPRDIGNKTLATLYADHPTNQRTMAAFHAAGVTPNPRFEAQYFVALFALLERGIACAVIDRLSIETYLLQHPNNRELVFRPFAPKILHHTSIIKPKYRPTSRVALAFHERFESALRAVQTSGVDSILS